MIFNRVLEDQAQTGFGQKYAEGQLQGFQLSQSKSWIMLYIQHLASLRDIAEYRQHSMICQHADKSYSREEPLMKIRLVRESNPEVQHT